MGISFLIVSEGARHRRDRLRGSALDICERCSHMELLVPTRNNVVTTVILRPPRPRTTERTLQSLSYAD